MADQKQTENFYQNLGGINQKASEYSLDKAQFLDIRNLDMQVPNALQKRPGSTQAVGLSNGTSGPITSLFEYQKLTGESYIIAGSDTAQFLLASNAFTLLSSGWNNGQPTDMLTFVNKLWMANGQKYEWWTGSTLLPAGLPCPQNPNQGNGNASSGASFWKVGNLTALPYYVGTTFSESFVIWGMWAAYSYVRSDGFEGPLDFYTYAKNVITGKAATNTDYFLNDAYLFGFTVPSGQGITAINIWIAIDCITAASGGTGVNGLGLADPGGVANNVMTVTLLPTADLARFYKFTSVPSASLFYRQNKNGQTYLATTFLPDLRGFTASNGVVPSLMSVCWYNTNTPKYIEQNQNVQFSAGFSNTPSTIWFSEVGEPEVIQPNYNFEVRTNDGDLITGMKAYNNTVVVTKERSFSKIIGSTPDDLELVELSQEYGCLSNKTMIQFKEKLLWLDRRGILEYNGSSWDIISTPVEDTFRSMNLSAARDKAVGVNHIYRNQAWFGIPIGESTKNNLTVVYDYLVGAWTFFDGYSPSSYALMKGALSTPTVWRGDYSGLVHYFGESMYSDNGQGITCLATPHFDKAKENETHVWRRFFLDVATATGITGLITGKVFSNYDRSTVQATFSMYQDAFQSRAEMGVPAKAVTAEFAHYSASLPLLVNGYSWAKRYLRNV